MGSPWVSNHARDRMARRHGGDPEWYAAKAWTEGLSRSQKRGVIRTYLDHLWDKNGRCAELKVYDDYVWVFKEGGLVTVYPVDWQFARHLGEKKLRERTTNA